MVIKSGLEFPRPSLATRITCCYCDCFSSMERTVWRKHPERIATRWTLTIAHRASRRVRSMTQMVPGSSAQRSRTISELYPCGMAELRGCHVAHNHKYLQSLGRSCISSYSSDDLTLLGCRQSYCATVRASTHCAHEHEVT
jgi:hypothetical protein